MAYGDRAWFFSRLYIGPAATIASRARGYGLDRLPEGGCVLAVNHLHWIDIGIVGALSPRNLNYVAKTEVRSLPGVGQYLDWHGIIAVRRGESDRKAVRLMRQYAAAGRVVCLFVEGTRQKTGRPAMLSPGRRWSRSRRVCPSCRRRSTAHSSGSSAISPLLAGLRRAFLLEGYPSGGRGYKEASLEIERRINVLFDWLADLHARGRPRGETPPV